MVRDLPLFIFSAKLPPLTFPTFGAQIFGSPPKVFFFSFSSSTVELAPFKYTALHSEILHFLQLEASSFKTR